MSFLPYGDGGGFGWVGAVGTSAALHGAAVVALVAIGGTTLNLTAVAAVPAPPPFQLSVEELDADTLAGLLEQAGIAASDGLAPKETDPAETNESYEVPSEGDGEGETDAEPEPEPLPVEVPDPVVPEAPVETAHVEPSISAPVAPRPEVESNEAVSPILSETVTALTSSATEVVTAASVAPTEATTLEASPITEGPSDTAITAVPVETTISSDDTAAAVETITSNLSEAQDTAAAAEPAAPPAPPTEQDLAVRDLIARIQQAAASPCLVALPRRDGVDGVGLAFLAAEDLAMEQFAQSLLTGEDVGTRQTRALIDPRQCAALDFVAGTQAYPAVQVGIQIDQVTVGSGGTLTGAMRGVGGGRFLTLVLVDDNGVVTDLQRFTATSGNAARFDVPVTRVGLARETRPLIIAIVSERAPTALRERLGLRAEDVFLDAVISPLGDLRIGLVAVDIR